MSKLLPQILEALRTPLPGTLGRRPLTSLRYAIQRTAHASGEGVVACWGADHTVLAVNAAALRVLPRPASAAGAPFRDIWPDLDAVMGPLLDAAFGGRPCALGESCLWVDGVEGGGRAEHYTSAVFPIPAPDGSLVGALWSFVATTAQVGNAHFLGTLLREPALRFVLVALPACTVEWASETCGGGADPTDPLAFAGQAAATLLPEAVCAALPGVTGATGTRVVGEAQPGTSYVLFPVTRPGALAGVLVVASPA